MSVRSGPASMSMTPVARSFSMSAMYSNTSSRGASRTVLTIACFTAPSPFQRALEGGAIFVAEHGGDLLVELGEDDLRDRAQAAPAGGELDPERPTVGVVAPAPDQPVLLALGDETGHGLPGQARPLADLTRAQPVLGEERHDHRSVKLRVRRTRSTRRRACRARWGAAERR